MVPAISMWAHFISGSLSSSGLAPSAKALRNNAAVHEPAGLPPVYQVMVVSILWKGTHKTKGGKAAYWGKVSKRTHILQIGITGIDLRAIIFIQRHAPESIVLDLTRSMELVPKFV